MAKKDIIDKLLDKYIFNAEWLGRHGEKLTERELKFVRLLGRDGKILRNVYVPKENGETSEIDVLYITQKGIFVIESKNYSGWIFGSEKNYQWTVSLPNGLKNKLYNPIKQNQTHIKWLQKYVGEDVPLFSIIVFSERCTLKIKGETSVPVIKRDSLYATIRNTWKRTEDKLSDEQVNELYEKLKGLTCVSKEDK
ncbi:MAG: NERD domain-containing protein [Holdemanella sp.]|nr:NERD domain-containing protein [Holdemanella sp.]